MKNKFDVIIIGAGPAGLKCSEQFKGSNFSVLLIEKNKVIGPKVCAGGLTALDAKFDIPKSEIKTFNKQIFCVDDKKYEIKLDYPIKTIDRYKLGQYLFQKVKDTENITVLKETVARQIKKNKIITNKGEFYYKYLVGADGSNSIVRKFLGLKSEISIGLRYRIPRITNDFVFFFYPKLLRIGYVWIFPHRDYTNIGVYFNPKYISPKRAKKFLNEFLEKKGFSYSELKLEGAPLNSAYKGCIFENVFLIGDAAGLVTKISGEGISFALTSGEEMGKKILNPDYNTPEFQRILKSKKKQDILYNIINVFPFLQKYSIKILINLTKRKWFQLYFGY